MPEPGRSWRRITGKKLEERLIKMHRREEEEQATAAMCVIAILIVGVIGCVVLALAH